MHRRLFLRSVGAFGAIGSLAKLPSPLRAAASPLARGRHAPRIGVAGGGILGASIAMHLAQAGAKVTLFEKTAPAAGATQASMAWMHMFEPDKHFQSLRLNSFLAYRELDQPLQLQVTWGGGLSWTTDPAEDSLMRTRVAWVQGLEIDGLPYAARMIDAKDFRAICGPCLNPGAMTSGFHSPIDGHIDPVWVTLRFLDQARLFGAQVIYPCEVQHFEFRRNRLKGVITTQGQFALDRLVLASGVDTPRLTSMVGYQLPMIHSPGMTAHSVQMPSFSRMAFNSPERNAFKQLPSGEIVAEANFGSPPALPQHTGILNATIPFPDKTLEKRHGEIVFSRISKYFTCASPATPSHIRLGFRPVTKDRLPCAGALPSAPDIYVATTREAVSLAAIMGRFVTRELLTDSPVEMLAPYRPERFV